MLSQKLRHRIPPGNTNNVCIRAPTRHGARGLLQLAVARLQRAHDLASDGNQAMICDVAQRVSRTHQGPVARLLTLRRQEHIKTSADRAIDRRSGIDPTRRVRRSDDDRADHCDGATLRGPCGCTSAGASVKRNTMDAEARPPRSSRASKSTLVERTPPGRVTDTSKSVVHGRSPSYCCVSYGGLIQT